MPYPQPVERSWRAAVLGLLLSGAMLLMAWGWWQAALSDVYFLWLSEAPVPIAEGVRALVQLAAATMWTLLTVILARATAAVVPRRRAGHPEQAGIPGRSAASVLTARVATALLILTCTGPSLSLAAAATPASTIPTTAGGEVAASPSTGSLNTIGGLTCAPARSDDDTDPDTHRGGSQIPVPGWLPASRAHPAGADVALLARGGDEDRLVTVRAGDTLWSIASDQLTGMPTIEQVAQTWPRWYAANRELIGPDPDLILPGQQLRPPAASSEGALP